MKCKLDREVLARFARHLRLQEKSEATIRKYMCDVMQFYRWLPSGKAFDKEGVIAYKKDLCARYAVSSVNGKLAALGSLFAFAGWQTCRVKTLRRQREAFCSENKELSRQEYYRLITQAEQSGKTRLSLIMQTLCGTGIRISELRFVTVQGIQAGKITVLCKEKTRTVFLPAKLCRKLRAYCRKEGVRTGSVFVTRAGNPVDRSNVWADMKALCREAGVCPDKVFPHNLRHLFARVFYQVSRDLSKLADVLGHASVDTTRIYIISSGKEHTHVIGKLRLIS